MLMCMPVLASSMRDWLATLESIRNSTGDSRTVGISDSAISEFLESDPTLSRAIDEAAATFERLSIDHSEQLKLDEASLVEHLQSDYVNFYSAPTVNPYVALSARGPWIVTSHGAVLHDNGGYGMLGMGHGPDDVLHSMKQNWVMANVMTPSFSQMRLAD